MRQRARTDLCGGRSAMTVPTATSTSIPVYRPLEPEVRRLESRRTGKPKVGTTQGGHFPKKGQRQICDAELDHWSYFPDTAA